MIAPASTGSARSRRSTVIPSDQTSKGTRSSRSPVERIFIIVVIKLRAPRIEETPAK